MTLTEIRPHVEAAWFSDTTYTPDEWCHTNPSRGNCAVTSVYLVRMFGGDLRKGYVADCGRKVAHYWAVIDGEVVDWTWQQFRRPRFGPQSWKATESDLIADAWMQERYDTFAARVDASRAKA